MVQYCPMVKGFCRGNACDFWARVKVRKLALDELVTDIKEYLAKNYTGNPKSKDDVIRDYWAQIGIKKMGRVCEEEPDLYTKMIDAEVLAKKLICTS